MHCVAAEDLEPDGNVEETACSASSGYGREKPVFDAEEMNENDLQKSRNWMRKHLITVIHCASTYCSVTQIDPLSSCAS